MIKNASGENVPGMVLNNVRYNNPILGRIETYLAMILFVGLAFLHIVLTESKEGQFWFYCAATFLFKTMVPALVILSKKDFRSFIWRSLKT